jgi:hypothetical protein
MLAKSLISLSSIALLAAATAAQTIPNQYPLRFVDAQGALRPVVQESPSQFRVAQFADEAVYVAFDPALPSGTYYVHVTDWSLTEVLSTNDPMDRFVQVTNTNGVITLSLPYTNNPNPALFGLGENGVGMSLALPSLRNSAQEPCVFKAWLGDYWDLSQGPEFPFLIRNGLNPANNQVAITSFDRFRIGNGNGSEVSGFAFLDADRDGVRDAGEGPLANWEVRLVTGQSVQVAFTDAQGRYAFPGVTAATYTVELQLPSGFVATTVSSVALEVCGCANVSVADFGAAPAILRCDGRTIGFWRNRHGLAIVHQRNILATLPGLYLRDLFGRHVAPGNLCSFSWYIGCANSINMAYMLSAQLVAMHCNVLAGFVDPSCRIRDSHLGNITIAELMQLSVQSLMANRLTLPGHPARAYQQRLKNALDNANNNRNWL